MGLRAVLAQTRLVFLAGLKGSGMPGPTSIDTINITKPLFSSLHTRSLAPHKQKPTNWNTTHSFVLQNPLLSLLEKCKSLSQLKQIQAQTIITGLISDGFALSRLIAFCAISESKDLHYCTNILFKTENPNVFSWNVAIRGFSESDTMREAVFLYKRMLRNGGSRPDHYTYPMLFKVCAGLGLKFTSHEILGHVLKLGFDAHIYVHNAVIHMLVSCGELGMARKVFDESCVRDLVSWNSLINGYVRSGFSREAIRLYRDMELEGVQPDEVTMIGMVSSCAHLEDLNLGREFHRYIDESGMNLTVPLANVLMDMYIKCGKLEVAKAIFDNMTKKTIVSCTTMIVGYAKFGFLDTARKIFCEMPEKDVFPWNAIIGGYVQAKCSKEALALFHEMQASNVKPDEVTMVLCLSACSQLGALDVGIWIHHFIEKKNLYLNVVLGTALVDMYAKCGNITKALQLLKLDPHDSAIYVLLANMYVDANMWEEARKARKMMKDRGVEKTPGCSSIEVNGIVYEFIVRDKSHPESKQIYDCLVRLTKQAEVAGYMADVPTYGDDFLSGFALEKQWPALHGSMQTTCSIP
ncbi:hypothetical protein Q3G72_016534 [Acer saccharum]|nr:hypothetical protein Q3G72_016534 [Acer saccharum]